MDDQLWGKLQQADPEIVSRNSAVSFNRNEECFHIPVLDEVYAVFPQDKKIVRLDAEKSGKGKYRIELFLFLLHYLLGTKDIPLAGKRISEKELRGGEMFFRGPHAPPTEGIVTKFGKNPQQFIDAGLRLGGKRVELGQAAIELRPAPKIPVTYVLWAEDEEFPAVVSILFDPTIQEFLPLDVIYGVTIVTHHRLAGG